MICPHCGYKNPNGVTEHQRCRSCREVMTAPEVKNTKEKKPAKKTVKEKIKDKITKKA